MEEKIKKQGRIRSEITKELTDREFVELDVKNRSLATALYQITRSHNFLGGVLQCMNIMYSHMLPTAGVTFNAELKRWDLYINPKFFCKNLDNVTDGNTGDKARQAIMLHELDHVLNKHPMRVPFMKISPHKRQLMNIAADMAINQYIKNLPRGCSQCPPPLIGKPCENPDCPGKTIDINDWYDENKDGTRTPWEKLKTMEYYYEKLLTKFQDNEDDEGEGNGESEKGEGNGKGKLPQTLDEHMWDASGEERDMLEATEDLVKRAMIKQRFSYDELDQNIKELLTDIKTRKAELDYRGEILAAIKKSASGNDRKNTWTKKSRRYGNKAPGTKISDIPKLSFYIDSSGSISVEEANEFLDIVDNFLKTGSRKCMLNIFHTSIYFSKEYKLGQRLKREEFQSGGTCLEDCMRNICDKKPDLSIIVTDGYYGDVDTTGWLPPGIKFPQCLFIISRQGDAKHPLTRFGKTIKIPESTKLKR
jgi:predicted metal-dependent peptidase